MSSGKRLTCGIDVIHCINGISQDHIVPQSAEVTITVRVPAHLARHAKAKAERRDETLSQVLRRALRDYVGRSAEQLDLEDAVRQ